MPSALVTGASSGIGLEIARVLAMDHDLTLAARSADKLDAMIELNVGALTRPARAYLPGMIERRNGRIMNVASTAAFQPGPLMAVYYATKAYVLSLSEALAEETRGTGVTVTALCPGPTASGFQAGAAMEDSRLVKGRKLPTAAEVAAYAVKAINRGDVVAVPGFMNKAMAASVRLSPRPVIRRVVHRINDAK